MFLSFSYEIRQRMKTQDSQTEQEGYLYSRLEWSFIPSMSSALVDVSFLPFSLVDGTALSS